MGVMTELLQVFRKIVGGQVFLQKNASGNNKYSSFIRHKGAAQKVYTYKGEKKEIKILYNSPDTVIVVRCNTVIVVVTQ
jgi:hypothetical protein